MAQTIEAVYEKGVFKPLQPVELAEGQKVALSVEPTTAPDEDTAEAEAVAFDHTALAAMADLWDNEEDAVYDNWRELYGVSER